MKSFSSMVTSFRVCFIEIKIKRWYFSLCLLRKRNKIISEWWHFSNLPPVLLRYLTPSLCSYVLWQLCIKSRYRLMCVCFVLTTLSQYCFPRDRSSKLINQVTKPALISCGFIYPIQKGILNIFSIHLKRMLILTANGPTKKLLMITKQLEN